ncbi:uncharacterized protein DUF533 [Rhodovulum bhavnagarense]|uniref:Uncharacterized protein DUF533 n=1 Tax=Rhodovulum bhavnagarense TaxID=992286 RepID=A0A4R2RGX8_9RHOB|nr:DUF533 domain-containing protein [Rhodovulum bhavnagarense]TCP62952.1 uncharacterized protein DUF533 [Rhodovulum bhavnagarense]
MSFLKTMASLAVGFAAAKGIDKFQSLGGGAGLASSMKSAAASGNIGNHIGALLVRMQVPGGADGLKDNVKWLGDKARATGDSAMMGIAGLMAALGGAQWAGSGNAKDILNAMGDGTPPGATLEAQSRLLIRAMIQAAKADGAIDAGERAHIMEVLGDATPAERAYVEGEMDRPVDIEALVAETGSYQRTAVYAVSVITANVLNPAEIAYLDRLAAALHLGQAARQRIHKAMRLPQVLS